MKESLVVVVVVGWVRQDLEAKKLQRLAFSTLAMLLGVIVRCDSEIVSQHAPEPPPMPRFPLQRRHFTHPASYNLRPLTTSLNLALRSSSSP